MSNISKLLIEEIQEVENESTGEKFPVVKITGITFSVSESGNSSFTKRRVSIPLNRLSSKAEAEQYFQEGSVLEGYELYKKPCEEYEYEAPDNRTYLLDYKWAIRKVGEEAHVAKRQEEPMEREVFSDTRKTNNLQPQL